jgi:hypothetical protein
MIGNSIEQDRAFNSVDEVAFSVERHPYIINVIEYVNVLSVYISNSDTDHPIQKGIPICETILRLSRLHLCPSSLESEDEFVPFGAQPSTRCKSLIESILDVCY